MVQIRGVSQRRTAAATFSRRDLPVGDYAVVRDEQVIASVERKRVTDLATAAVSGALRLARTDKVVNRWPSRGIN